MSLINEALKRTRDLSYQPGPNPAAPPAAYRITAPARESSLGARPLLLIAGLGIVALAIVGGYLFRQRPPVVVAAPAVVETPAPVAPPVPPPATPVVPAAPDAPPVAAPVRPAPALRLEGIMRGGRFNEAMINGYTYRVGDEVEGAQITAIEDGLARLTFDGRELLLRLR